jgi:hypothetical protein
LDLEVISTAGTPTTDATEEYDGSTWTGGGNLGTGRRALAGAGIQTAGLAFGGTTGSILFSSNRRI